MRLLARQAPVDAAPPGMDFAERLSLWLNAFDAIGLQAAHQSLKSSPLPAAPAGGRRRAPTPQALEQDVQRVRDALAHAIAQDPQPLPPLVLPSRKGTRPVAPAADEAAANGYARFHQRHLELQRQMEQMITPLRDHVRQSIGQADAGLRQLATLDAVFEQALARREQALMPTAVHLMQRRYEQLRQAHAAGAAAAAADDEAAAAAASPEPAAPPPDNDWQQDFAHEWRQVLLAELELRLQPVTGLVEALRKQWKQPS